MSQNNPPFQIGQKVVCVKAFNETYDRIGIKKGDILTIRKIEMNPRSGEWFCQFEEIINKPHNYNEGFAELLYFCGQFAPINTNYSDATAEILEKFKSPAETPDKVIIPEKATNHL